MNYRPISITCVACKVQESIIHDSMLLHLVGNNLIASAQHGFLPGKSCTTNLLEAYDVMSKALELNLPVDVIVTDFWKAFDSAAHRRLLLKLGAYGIRGKLLEWIADWLHGRKQRVVFGAHTAEWKDVTSGVPQGSVLGPLLFLLFINDFPDALVSITKLYADDAKLLSIIKAISDAVQLQLDIDKCTKWANTWLMKFNIAKCKVMHVGGKTKSQHVYTMEDADGVRHTLETSSCERDLGVLVTNDLTFNAQCRAAAANANWKFGVFKKSFSSRSERLWQKLWKTHIRPHLEHAVQAWSPYLQGDINVLERVQRRVSKHIAGMADLAYDQRLDHLGWTTLVDRRHRGDAIFTFQQLRRRTTLDIDWHQVTPLSQVDGPVGAVRANNVRLAPPIARKPQRCNFLPIRMAGPMQKLPAGIMDCSSVNSFKNNYDAWWKL